MAAATQWAAIEAAAAAAMAGAAALQQEEARRRREIEEQVVICFCFLRKMEGQVIYLLCSSELRSSMHPIYFTESCGWRFYHELIYLSYHELTAPGGDAVAGKGARPRRARGPRPPR